jgi:hypothetical protein
VEIREVHEPNDGRDPFPVLVCRQKLAKNPKEIPRMLITHAIVMGNSTLSFCLALYPTFSFSSASFPTAVLEVSADEINKWYSPQDFAIGNTINVLGKNFFL